MTSGYGNFKGASKYIPAFNTNDRVRVVNKSDFTGDEGIVILRKKVDGKFIYGVDFQTGGAELYFFQDELERIDS